MVGSQVRFDHQGDGLGRYNIYNFQRLTGGDESEGNGTAAAEGNGTTGGAGGSKTQQHRYGYAKVGVWFEDVLSLEASRVLFNARSRQAPSSVCSLPCSRGHVKVTGGEGSGCCWMCVACRPSEFVSANGSACLACEDGWWPVADRRSGCARLASQHLPRWDSGYGLIAVGTAVSGMALTAFVARVMYAHRETPIVRASGRELSFILLSGCFLCFGTTFVLLAPPSVLVCGASRLSVPTSFCVMYAALLTKTQRIARIFESARRSARAPSCISPASQVAICSGLTAVQLLGTTVWLLLEPPDTRLWVSAAAPVVAAPAAAAAAGDAAASASSAASSTDGNNPPPLVLIRCRVPDSSFAASLAYDVALVLVCTLYAVKTRKIPENFNESKFIGFTMYTTCII